MRLPLDGDSVNARILRTGRSARLNFAEEGSGSIAEVLRRDNVNATVGAPIVVDGALWGMIGASWRGDDQPPANAEKRVEKFTELVATAIANTESRAELAASEARARDLAGEQAALRRVATLVAKGASSDELFAAVTREAADVLDVPVVALQRYEPDRMFTMVGIAGETSFTVGSRWPVEDEGLAGMILATGTPGAEAGLHDDAGTAGRRLESRRDDLGGRRPDRRRRLHLGVHDRWRPPGETDPRRHRGASRPIHRAGRNRNRRQPGPRALRSSRGQRPCEQVARCGGWPRMVARAPASEQLFSTVAREVASVLDVPGVIVTRYEPDGTAVTVGEAFGPDLAGAEQFLGIGTPMPPDPGTLTALVFDTHEPGASRRLVDISGNSRRGCACGAARFRLCGSNRRQWSRLGQDVRLLAGRNGTSRGNGESPPATS